MVLGFCSIICFSYALCPGKEWSGTQDGREPDVEASWNVMAHTQKPDFVFRRKGRVHLNRLGRQFSRLLAAEVCASAIVMLDTPCSEVVRRVLATYSIRQFPLHFPSHVSPCAITFQLESTLSGLLGYFHDPKDGGSVPLWNVCNHVPFDAVYKSQETWISIVTPVRFSNRHERPDKWVCWAVFMTHFRNLIC